MFERLVIATGNPGKVREMRSLLDGLGVSVVGLGDLGQHFIEPEETGATFDANAQIKALSYAQQTGLACLADDSGLEVDALSGAPGVISSHYATDGVETGLSRAARDAANNQRLMRELDGVAEPDRSARFVCVMTLALPGPARVVATARGIFEGAIGLPGDVPRGTNGFGYDPLFVVGASTSAQLDPARKNELSHRGRAARAMIEIIRSVQAGDAWPIA